MVPVRAETMGRKRDRLRGYEPVNHWVYIFMSLFMRTPIRWGLRFIPENIHVIPNRGPGILVANHVHLMDPIWIYDSLLRPIARQPRTTRPFEA